MKRSKLLYVIPERKKSMFSDNSFVEERSRLNLNGSRQLSKSATELRNNDSGSPSRRGEQVESGVVHHHRHHRHATSVAQRTHIFFATLKSRWGRNRSKERKKSRDGGSGLPHGGIESDYAADYSSEHSKSSSATQSPARHCLNHPGTYIFFPCISLQFFVAKSRRIIRLYNLIVRGKIKER